MVEKGGSGWSRRECRNGMSYPCFIGGITGDYLTKIGIVALCYGIFVNNDYIILT